MWVARRVLLFLFLASACQRTESVAPTPPTSAPTGSVSSPLDVAVPMPVPMPVPVPAPPLPSIATDWCTAGMLGLDEETCYLLPARSPTPTPEAPSAPALVIYLPGIVPPVSPNPQLENVDRIVHDVATARGFAAMIPRGRRGIGPPHAKDYYAWPTNAADYAAYAPAMIAHWLDAKQRLERALGRPFERLYVAGSSSGAWFVVALAFRGALAADGWAAISGGSPGTWTARDLTARTPKPFYIGFGANDPSAADGARALTALLRTASWPVEAHAHPFGHGARAIYLEEAFATWAR